MSISKKRNIREPLTLEDKLKIISDHNENKLTTSQLALKYSRPTSTISTILNKEKQNQILQHFNKTPASIGSKRLRPSNFPKVEQALDQWYKERLNEKIAVDGPMIQAQAIKYATILNEPEFKASNGWLDGFKRFFIMFRPQRMS